MRACLALAEAGEYAKPALPDLLSLRRDDELAVFAVEDALRGTVELGESLAKLSNLSSWLEHDKSLERDLNAADASFLPYTWLFTVAVVGAHDLEQLADAAVKQRRAADTQGCVFTLEACFASACRRAAASALPALRSRLIASDAAVLNVALAGIVGAGGQAAELASFVAPFCASQDASIRTRAVEALVAISEKQSELARAPLEAAMHDVDPRVRIQAARGLVRVLGDTSNAGALFVEGLGDPQPGVRAAAARGLEELKPPHAPAFERLLSCLDDRDPWVRAGVARALGAYVERAAASSKPLAKLLHDREPAVRAAAESALKALGQPTKSK